MPHRPAQKDRELGTDDKVFGIRQACFGDANQWFSGAWTDRWAPGTRTHR